MRRANPSNYYTCTRRAESGQAFFSLSLDAPLGKELPEANSDVGFVGRGFSRDIKTPRKYGL
jgi:hypothetical protein